MPEDPTRGAAGLARRLDGPARMTTPTRPASTALEIELKYRMTDVATGERLIAADDLAGFSALGARRHRADRGPLSRHRRTAPSAAAGYAGRLRSGGKGGTVITLKGLRRAGRGRRRPPPRGARRSGRRGVPGGVAGPPPPPGMRSLAIAGEDPLVDLVRIRQARRKRLYGRDDAVVEVSVDDVEVVAGGRIVERFAELELELRERRRGGSGAAGRPPERGRGAGARPRRRSWSARSRPCGATRPPAPAAEPTNAPAGGRRCWTRRPRPRRGRRGPTPRRPTPGRRPGSSLPKTPGVLGRRPSRRGRAEGAPLPPGAHARSRGGDPRGQGRRGAARDARRDASPAGRVARVRRRASTSAARRSTAGA